MTIKEVLQENQPISGAISSSDNENINCCVKIPNGNSFFVNCNLKNTVETLKFKISEICSIPIDQQRLVFKGTILHNEKILENYNGFGNDSIVYLLKFIPHNENIEISIKCLFDNSEITISCKSGLTIAEFKLLIQKEKEIHPNQQFLVFNGQELKDQKTIDSYGVVDKSNLELSKKKHLLD